MKKFIVNMFLILGLGLNSTAQSDSCFVDYYNVFNMDSVKTSTFGDEIHIYFSNQIRLRYFNILSKQYTITNFFIYYKDGEDFGVLAIGINCKELGYTQNYTPCMLEELINQ